MTKCNIRDCLLSGIKILFLVLMFHGTAPFLGGLWYSQCGERKYEQEWLNRVIQRLEVLEARCTDQKLRGIIQYTTKRYNKIGGFDVMVVPCFSADGKEYIGLNQPFCPGITIDPKVLRYPVNFGAMLLVHEAMHDYWPCWGHAHVDPVMESFDILDAKN